LKYEDVVLVMVVELLELKIMRGEVVVVVELLEHKTTREEV
jgi:hypothetical protein